MLDSLGHGVRRRVDAFLQDSQRGGPAHSNDGVDDSQLEDGELVDRAHCGGAGPRT